MNNNHTPVHTSALDSVVAAAPSLRSSVRLSARGEKSTATTCPYCGVGCGVIAQTSVDANGTTQVTVKGDPWHPANYGRLCAKGMQLGKTLLHPKRLSYPQIQGQRQSWSVAIAHIAQRFTQTIAEHGPESVAFYLSGQLLTEDYYVANKLMKGFIGSANVDTNSRLCMSSAVVAHKRAFGSDTVPGCYEDFELADLVILAGSNLAWCQPVLFQRMLAAKAVHPERKLVVIDPRCSATAEAADLHLALAPNSDLSLWHGLLHYLLQRDVDDRGYKEGLCAAQLAHIQTFDVARVAHDTELDIAQIKQFYQWFEQTERTVSGFSMGSNQSQHGVANGNAIINCHLFTRRLGRPGMGPFSITGQPNAMGGREVGGLATTLAAHVEFAETEKVAAVAQVWGSERMARNHGLTAVPMFEAMAAGKIKAIWILGTNPAVSLPDNDLIQRALTRCDTVVISDCSGGTDSQQFADVLLPALGWGEKSGTVTNAERRISRQRAFVQANDEARADWWAICQVAQAMGFGHAFNYANEAEIFAEHAQLSQINGGSFDISGLASLTAAQYQQLPPLQWPQRSQQPLQLQSQRLFNPSVITAAEPTLGQLHVDATQVRLSQGTWLLNSGRSRDQWHTMTRTGAVAALSAHQPMPQLHIHPDDLAQLTMDHNTLLLLNGKAAWPVQADPNQRRGELFAPIHWSAANSSTGNVNRLTDRQVDGLSAQPAFKTARVEVQPQVVNYWGQLLLPMGVRPPLTWCVFWAKQAVDGGVLWWLASDRVWRHWQSWLQRQPLGKPWSSQQQPQSQTLLMAHQQRLSAAMQWTTQRQQLAGSSWFDGLGKRCDMALLQQLLGAADQRRLCVCVGRSVAQVDAAIAAGAQTVAQVQQACGAGGGCGVCQMEIQERCRQALAVAAP
ncbi:MAG: molybdopterin-dependent oxidoreductase [Ferrimonas sp.]